jgi:hypothetical protein
MPRFDFKFIIPLAFLMILLIVVFNGGDKKPAPPPSTQAPASETQLDPSRFLVRPFHTEQNQIALALDGGSIPITKGEVPSMIMGKNMLRTLHLVWVHDWSNVDCRTSFRNLQDLYKSEQGESLPALKLYIMPVFSDATGEALHRAMLQILFRSRIRENYSLLATELCSGKILPNAEAIRKRVEEIDPLLIDDWDTPLEWLENDITKTFATAKTQQARNTKILGQKQQGHLTSLLTTLSPLASSTEIATFLQDANAHQRSWLQQTTQLNAKTETLPSTEDQK